MAATNRVKAPQYRITDAEYTSSRIDDRAKDTLLRIAANHGGLLSPLDILNEAKKKASPLNGYFNWDDTKAANLYRLDQARAIISSVRIEIIRENSKTKEVQVTSVRAFESRQSMRSSAHSYEAIQNIYASTEATKELVQQVLRQLQTLRTRYQNLTDLESVWEAVDTILATKK